jgi:hypothetical protein
MTSSHQQLAELKQFVQDNKQHRVAHLRGVHLFPDRIIRLPEGLLGGLLGGGMQNMTADAECYPLASVTATVEQAGGVSVGGRSTLTRSLVPGMHGWQKKTEADTREAWLVVSGPQFQWQVQLVAKGLTGTNGEVGLARQFAAKINGAASKFSGPPQQNTTQPASPMDELVKLADLHTRGLLTREEFEVGKRRFLGMQ